MTNRAEYVCTWFGLAKTGVVAALLNSQLRAGPLAHCANVSRARHVILGAELLESWRSAAAYVEPSPIVWVQGPVAGEAAPGARRLDEALTELSGSALAEDVRDGLLAEDTALYIYTSGTTGLPKAVKLSHIRALTIMHSFACFMGSDRSDRIYLALPLYHATAGLGGLGAALTTGGCVVIRDRFRVSEFWGDIATHDCTMFVYVGEICRYLVNGPPHPDERRHRVRCCMGNGLRPDVWARFRDRFALPHIVEFYASTEGTVSLFNLDDKVGAIGRLPPYMESQIKVKLVEYDIERDELVRDASGRCIECAYGTVGEAIGLIDPDRRGAKFDGYTDARATAKKIVTDAFEPGDRWFRTGDLLTRDADGYFYFVDRVGDTFRWKGENVATSEVAEVLGAVPTVAEANVYGVRVPGAEGRVGMAAIVPRGELDLAAVYAHVERELASYARPLFIREQGAMEVTGTFKHRKIELVREGFDLARVPDPLYVRDDARRSYVPLTPERHAAILAGERRI